MAWCYSWYVRWLLAQLCGFVDYDAQSEGESSDETISGKFDDDDIMDGDEDV